MSSYIRHTLFQILCTLSLAIFISCDDGSVTEKTIDVPDGRTARLTALVSGADTWPKGYDLAFAGFSSDDDYASVVRLLRPAADGTVDVTLTNIPSEVTSLELCIVNTLHQRVSTYARLEGTALQTDDLILLRAGDVDVGMYATLQTDFFDRRCISCHGGSSFAARGLYLTSGKSYEALVGAPSKRVEGQLLVEPGSPRSSILYQVVTTDLTADWGQSHADMLSPEKDSHLLTLLADWIRNGAKE